MLQYASSNMDVDNKNSKYIFKLYTVYFNNLCLYYFSLCSDMLDIKRNVHKTQYWDSQRSGKIPRESQRPKRHGL